MVRPLTAADQRRLVAAFLGVDGMRRRKTRDVLVAALERDLGHPIPVERHEQDSYDVWGLIDACLAYPGAVRTLVDILDGFHGGSQSMMQVRGVVDEMFPEPLLDAQERRALHKLISEAEAAQPRAPHHAKIAALYRDAVGPMGPALDHDGQHLTGVLAQLEELTADATGIPPLLRFIERYATHLDDPAAAGPRSWVDDFALRHRLDAAAVRGIRAEASRALEATQTTAYLVIEFAPDGVDPDFYLLSAWLQYGDEPALMLRQEDRPLGLRELPTHVTALLMEDDHVVNRLTPDLTIEFIVPRRLLGEPIDQWRLTMAGLERRLGIEHPVVVRTLDRLRQHAQHHNWRRKWSWLCGNPGAAAAHRIRRPGGTGGEVLYNRLLSEQSTVCVALAFAPAATRQSVADELDVAVQAGVPVIVWCRHDHEPERFEEEFQHLLDAGILRLPENVMRLRRQAVKAQEAGDADGHPGFHLTLLFDNADRIPEPYIRLSPPV